MTAMQEPLSPADSHDDLRQSALDAARAGLDFLVRHQVTDAQSADHGRFPFCFDCTAHRAVTLTTNWTTGIAVDALLAGFGAFGDERYRDAARRATAYLRSLQEMSDVNPRVRGVFREVTPQSGMAHPRDALTAALALLGWSQTMHDPDAFERARLYADWFVTIGMERGYPYWTVRFDDQPWEPDYCGSFHSGSAFFLARMYEATNDAKYRKAMGDVLDHYNGRHLDADGRVTVILDRQTHAPLDGKADPRHSNPGWEMMHVYNDDFGALANLAAWRLNGNPACLDAASRFLKRMLRIQRADGGFGPADRSVPSAAGVILTELLAAHALGHALASPDQLSLAAQYLIDIQVRDTTSPAYGSFLGFTDQYILSRTTTNIRAGAYAISALLRYAGVRDTHYFLV